MSSSDYTQHQIFCCWSFTLDAAITMKTWCSLFAALGEIKSYCQGVLLLMYNSKAISKETQRVMPKFRWSIAESGLLEAASDVVMLFDLRGDVDDDLPTCRPNTSEYLQQASINKLLINYSAPNTPRDAGKSFAYTKILRDHLRSTALSHTPFVTINSAHKHVGDYIFQAHDRLGVAIVPFCFDFPSMEMQPDMPLITFDSTYPSVDLLKGVGDSRWGPLGR